MSTPRNQQKSFALIYAGMIPVVQRIGREHGYAIAVHGSMATDLDLVAIPWIPDAKEPGVLIEAIREHFQCLFFVRNEGQPESKPHGRLAWSMAFAFEENRAQTIGGPYLDISVMPRSGVNQ